MRLLPVVLLSTLGLALAGTRGARAEDAKPQVAINEKEHTATIHFGDPEATTERFSGVRVGINKFEVTSKPGAASFSVKIVGYIGNGFPEDIFVRKVDPEEIEFHLSASTKGARAISALGITTFRWPERNDWLLFRGRTFTGHKSGVRDDSGEFLSFTRTLSIVQPKEGAWTIKPGVATADLTMKATIRFNRIGSPTVHKVEVTIPLHAAISAPPAEK